MGEPMRVELHSAPRGERTSWGSVEQVRTKYVCDRVAARSPPLSLTGHDRLRRCENSPAVRQYQSLDGAWISARVDDVSTTKGYEAAWNGNVGRAWNVT